MENPEFDEFSRTLATASSRRQAVGMLAGLLGLGALGSEMAAGENAQRRRRERRRHQQRRRKDRRASGANKLGIKLTVVNPLGNPNPQTIEVELGFGTESKGWGQCCQGQAGYQLTPGQIQPYSTEEDSAYIWIENKYFIWFVNPNLIRPYIGWSYMGSTEWNDPRCCKPRGEQLGTLNNMDEGQSAVLDFHGRQVLVSRDHDSTHKSFSIVLA